MTKQDIEKFCGEYPDNFEPIKITNDPNFVFPNDLNFETVSLWDKDGNTVSVNSFVECEVYVSGGWNQEPPLKFIDKINSLEFLSILLLSSILLNIFYRKFLLKNLNN